MKHTIFYEIHKALNAKIVPFAGFNMPVEYSGLIDEHLTVRNKAGIFDVSHMGEFMVKDKAAKDFLQRVTCNDISRLTEGKIQYTCFINEKGGIIDDLLVYYFGDDKYLLVVNASNTEKDWNWLTEHNISNAVLENLSDSMSQIAVQGPLSADILQPLTGTDLFAMKSFNFVTSSFAGLSDVIISKTGYTGSDGFELYFSNQHGIKIWNSIMESGKSFGLKPAGLGARDTLRLEAGLCLYGNDIDDTTSPLEAGLGWITKFTEGNNFIGREVLEIQKKNGISKKLIGFKMIDRGIPRHDYEIYDETENRIGRVTSGTMSPLTKEGIGMAYVNIENSSTGREIFVKIRNNMLKAEVVQLPFYKRD